MTQNRIKMKNAKKLVAITGGIGSGKSLALTILNEKGYSTLSCDKIVSDLYKTHKVKLMLKALFPDGVNGNKRLTIDRKAIAQKTFSDKGLHKQLTDLITPLVIKRVQNIARRTKDTLFVEVPLLFECNYQNYFDYVLVIMRNKSARIESVKLRSNLTEKQVLDRIKSQIDYDKLDLTNFIVLQNDGEKGAFAKALISAIEKIL